MAHKWPYFPIEDVSEKVAMGPFGSSIKVSTFVPNGIPVISGQHLHGLKVADTEFNFITEKHAERLKNANVMRGDVIFTHAGNIGQVAYVPDTSRYERYVISQRQFYMRCNTTKILPEFITYFFKTREGQHKLLANTSSTGVPSIARPVTYLRSIEVPVPPLATQRRIAHILGALDDKIELNQRMNRTLEQMAAAIFKSWFIDFDPVLAKAEGRDPKLPPEITDLFPDAFEESEVGLIPMGWEVSRFGDLLELAYGKSLKAQDRRPGLVAVYGSNGQVGWHDSALASGPGVIVGRKGNPGIVTWAASDFFPIDTTFYVVATGQVRSLYFLYYVLRNHDLASLGADSAVPGLNRNMAYMSKQIVPPSCLVMNFDAFVRPIFDRIHACEQQNLCLAYMRDALLPKLLTGENQLYEAATVAKEVGS